MSDNRETSYRIRVRDHLLRDTLPPREFVGTSFEALEDLVAEAKANGFRGYDGDDGANRYWTDYAKLNFALAQKQPAVIESPSGTSFVLEPL